MLCSRAENTGCGSQDMKGLYLDPIADAFDSLETVLAHLTLHHACAASLSH